VSLSFFFQHSSYEEPKLKKISI